MLKLAMFVVRRRWWVIAATIVALPLAALYGGGVHDKLSAGGFTDPSSESSTASKFLTQDFPSSGQSDFVVLVTARSGTVDTPSMRAAGNALTTELAHQAGVQAALSYWSLDNAPPLKSRDGHMALIVASLHGSENQEMKLAQRLSPLFTVHNARFTSAVTGRAEITRQVSDQAERDLQKADTITVPLTLIALIIVFGSVVSALLPLAVGAIAVLGTFVVLTLLTSMTEVSVFALNLTTALGLGLAIDYSLFVVSRYREELARGISTNLAVGRTMQTAGRTVVFSAATVAISLTSLALFPVAYLRSFAYAGVAVVALAAVAAVVVLPAVLAVLGSRIEKGRVYSPREREDGGFWRRQADRVMRRPLPYAVAVTLVLGLLAIPFFHASPGLSDDRVVPTSVSSRAATDEIRKNFASRESDALAVVAPHVTAADNAAVDRFATALAKLPGVSRVDAITGYYLPVHGTTVAHIPANKLSQRFAPAAGHTGTYLSVVPDIEPMSARGERLVHDLRATHAPFQFLVTGPSAQLVDTKATVFSRLPIALALIAIATFILLFLMTGSVLVPLKALMLNVLSLTATFGATVWIFQDGHLSGLLGFTATGTIDVFTPILMFCIAFGLSMDYEVFLLSRIKEEYDLDRNNEHAVAVGLQKTGRIVTAAALLLTIVFVGIATSEVAIVKAFGVGLALAVLVDAFLIRATLVPAFMRLAGRSNWWSPRALRRWHLRYGIWENEPIALLDREFESRVAPKRHSPPEAEREPQPVG